jgi:protein-S-isoprenylcysteine O-methyltransferase
MDYGRIILGLWLAWLAYWIVNWTGNKRTVQESRMSGRLLVFVFMVGLYFGLYHSSGWVERQVLPHNNAMKAAGTVLCALGLGFAIWARRVLGTNWSANPTVKEGHELITTGPYRLARHPIYTGLLLALFGTTIIASGEVRDFIFFASIAIGLHFKSRIEERFMMQTFPDTYPAYRRRVKAIIPFVL